MSDNWGAGFCDRLSKGNIMTCNLKVKRIDKDLPLPRYSRDGDACLDLYTSVSGTVMRENALIVPTGLAVQIPQGYVGVVRGRSGNSFKYQIELHNGIIDSNFRGEIKLNVFNTSKFNYSFRAGDRLAQLLILPIPQVNVIEVDELEETNRGAKGFGSSGV